jgi:hypothetical protein
MLVSLTLDADFSEGCALPVIAYRFLATHPHALSEGPEPLQRGSAPMRICPKP